ncbi:MAG: hypothetical protein WA324_04970 [Bryobacteraceae bacterium]
MAITAILIASAASLQAGKISIDERLEIERGLSAELATSKILLPRAKKPLVFKSDGTYDRAAWDRQLQENGPAAKLGDQIQITKVTIEAKRIVLEINGGMHGGSWKDHVQIGMNGSMNPVNTNQNRQTNGSNIVLVFPGDVPSLKSADIRQMLTPILDFEKHSAAEQYVSNLPAPVQKAIKENRAIKGMDRDQVLLAMGKPHNKERETNADGDEVEDWIYGEPPGKVTFVEFNEGKVVKVEQSYANIGGTTAPPLPSPL